MITPSDASCIPATEGYRFCFNRVRYYSNSSKRSKSTKIMSSSFSSHFSNSECYHFGSKVFEVFGPPQECVTYGHLDSGYSEGRISSSGVRCSLCGVRCPTSGFRMPLKNLCKEQNVNLVFRYADL